MRACLHLRGQTRALFVGALAAFSCSTAARAQHGRELYRLEVAASAVTLAPAEVARVSFGILAKPGAQVSAEAPLRLSLRPVNLRASRTELTRADGRAEGRALRLALSVTGGRPGPARLEARLVFFVCTARRCVRQSRELTLPFTIKR